MGKVLLASPLFILREDCGRDLKGVLHRLGEVGFDGVEFLGLFGNDARQVRHWLDGYGLTAMGDHVSMMSFMAEPEKTLVEHAELGCKYLTVGSIHHSGMPGGEMFVDTCEQIGMLAEMSKPYNIRLLYHNHDFELIQKVEGKSHLELLMDEVPIEAMAMEPDLGWIAIGGGDPAYFLTQYRNRCPVIHLKDYIRPDDGHFTFRPTGYGQLNLPQLLPLCLACEPEWLVMDHDDAYDRDSIRDLEWSLEYVQRLLTIATPEA